MENLNLEHKDNISKFLHRDLMFLINSYVTMLISLLIPAHGQLPNVEHTQVQKHVQTSQPVGEKKSPLDSPKKLVGEK